MVNGVDTRSESSKINPNSLEDKDTIGITIESRDFPITLDEFWFAINTDTFINPFDFVSVENVLNSVTIGIVKESRTVKRDSVIQYKYNESQLPAAAAARKNYRNNLDIRSYSEGTRIARIAVMANMLNPDSNRSDNHSPTTKTAKTRLNIRMPVGIGKAVKFAKFDEIVNALGNLKMENPVYCGIMEMTNGLRIPILMPMSYLAGPDSANVNASGISGNLKTSYLLFLLHSVYQKQKDTYDVAIIIFNTRQDDLLHLDEPEDISNEDNQLYDLLKVRAEPFYNVTYFLPRGSNGKPISTFVPSRYKTYSYELGDIYDRLDLLLSSEAYDPQYNLSSIVNYIYENWPLSDSNGNTVKSWSDLFAYKEYPQEIITQKSSFLRFLGYLQKFRKSSMFTDMRKTSIYIGEEIDKIKPGDVFVIDIAMVPTVEEQSLVVGDVMKNIDEMYSSRYSIDTTIFKQFPEDKNDDSEITDRLQEKPFLLLIFIDEINRFLPASYQHGAKSPVAEQIIKTLVAGRSRNTVLFSAQQFKSATDSILHEYTGIHTIAKLGLSELNNPVYNMLDDSTKRNITHMDKGELVMVQPSFRHPIKIIIPKLPFRRQAR